MTLAQMYDLYKNTYTGFADIGDATYQHTGLTPVTEVKTRKCIPEVKELQAIGVELKAQSKYATFIMWDVTLDGNTPKVSGKITWSGTIWTIVSLWQEHFETQWRCLCIKDKS